MLELKNIKKVYETAEEKVEALESLTDYNLMLEHLEDPSNIEEE